MSVITYTDRVKKYFSFLETEYGFMVDSEINSNISPTTDGEVVYVSQSIAIVIDSETGSAAIWFYRIKDGRKYALDPIAIHEYMMTNSQEKELLLSTNPVDNNAATTLFNEKFLLNQPGWRSGDSTEEKLEFRLFNYANWLREHVDICLTDGFPDWLKFYEYKVYRSRADYLRLGKQEIGPAAVRDADGKLKTVRQSRFQDKLDYIEKLKNEASK